MNNIICVTGPTASGKTALAIQLAMEQNGEVVPCDELPKSFILTAEYGFNRVYLTEYYSATLEKRLK